MGRELKKVPLDFNWPLKKIWKGYTNPYYVNCPDCKGIGYSLEWQTLRAIISLLCNAADDSKTSKEYVSRGHVLNYLGINKLGKDFYKIVEGLVPKEEEHFACGVICKKLLKLANLPEDWCNCKTCDGTGIHKDYLEKYEGWERSDPPLGEGFQLWESTSEGSPVSPVFQTLDELCKYAEANVSVFGNEYISKDQWKKMLEKDFVYFEKNGMIFI